MKKLFYLLIILSFPTFSYGICQRPPAKLCNVFFGNGILVAHGKVTKAEYVSDLQGDSPSEKEIGWRYKIDLIKIYKGRSKEKIIVESENGSGQVILTANKEYIIFVYPIRHGVYEIWNNCEGIQGINGEPYTIKLEKEIYTLQKEKNSFIEGEVVDGYLYPVPFQGSVRVSGNGRTFDVPINSQGSFKIELPPGTYQVLFPDGLRESSYSFYDIPKKKIILEPGECAQIQFYKCTPELCP
jgi:hypothetical protein